jgi:hypothetical protein
VSVVGVYRADIAQIARDEYARRYARAYARGAPDEARKATLRIWRAIGVFGDEGARGLKGIDGISWADMCATANNAVAKGLIAVREAPDRPEIAQRGRDLARLAGALALAADAWENALDRKPGDPEPDRFLQAFYALFNPDTAAREQEAA